MITLRDYQSGMRDEARALARAGKRRTLLVAPTGAGKRLMACHAIGTAAQQGYTSVFLVHRQELLDQASETLTSVDVPHGIIKAGIKPEPYLTQVASVQSLGRRLADTPEPHFLFVDEAHHSASTTFARILSAWPNAYVLAYTATPARLDGKGLGKFFDAMVVGPSMRELIDKGYLADYRLFAPPPPDLGAVSTIAGDFRKDELAAAVDRPKIIGDVVEHYQRIAPGKQAICFAVNILHSKRIVEAFQAAGIDARHADGETPRDQRRQILTDFAAGHLQVLSNVDILGEGLDVAGIEAVILARPTRSLTLYLQQVGRALRLKPGGSRALVIDHAGNSGRLGMPDAPRDWVLTEDRIKHRRVSATPVKTCPECFAVGPAGAPACEVCGHRFVAEPRKVRHATGELVEVAAASPAPKLPWAVRLAEQRAAANKSIDALIALGRTRGYRYPVKWAQHVFRGTEKRMRSQLEPKE